MRLRVAKKVVGIVGSELPQRHRTTTAERALRRVEKTQSSKDAERFWNELMPVICNRQRMSLSEAERAYDEAPSIPMSREEIDRIVANVTGQSTRQQEPRKQGE